jgi:hypothetical protein
MSAIKPPPCTPAETIWLELIGEQSMGSHQYLITEVAEDGSEAVVPMEECADRQGRMGPILAGHAAKTEQRNLLLELEGEQTIRIPVVRNEEIAPYKIRPTRRNYQDNLLVAIHPTLFCDAGELSYPRPLTGYEEGLAGPLRTGWVYVFFRGELWRELFIITSEDSAPVMRDIDLAGIRAGGKDRNERPPVGPEIDTIHIPARLLGNNVYEDVELAFSDSQWSWQHIEALESDSELRKKRCRNGRAVKGMLARMPKSMLGDWHRVDELVPMRARDHRLEQDAFMPNQWLRDVDGSETRALMEEVKAQREAIESDKRSVEWDMGIHAKAVSPHWRHELLKGESLPEIPEGTDVFESLRNRNVHSLTLRDPLFAARHIARHMNECLALLLALVDNVKKRPYGVTAELFHNNFRREVLPDGSPNPIHIDGSWFDNRLDDSKYGRLQRTVYQVERGALRRSLLEGQGVIVRLLEDDRPENLTEVLRDLFDAEVGSDVAGYVQAGPLLQLLSLTVGRCDPLMLPQEAGRMRASGANDMNESLMTGEHALAAMLLPFKSAADALPGDASNEKLKGMISALQDRAQPMRLVEAEVLRSLSDHMDSTSAPEASEIFYDTRFSMHSLSAPFSEIGQWWLGGVQEKLEQKGAVFEAKVSQVKGAFEGFAEAAIPGRTNLQIEGADDGKPYMLVEVVDEQGQTMTSGAAVGATLKLADVEGFTEAAKSRPVGQMLHAASVSPIGLPPFLVALDLYNFVNAAGYEGPENRKWVGVTSALADLVVSSGQFLSVLPQRSARLDKYIGAWRKDAKWFTSMSSKVKIEAAERYAETVTRSKLSAAGWLAGNLTVSIMIWDAAGNALRGRFKLASADLTKAVGVGVVNSSDIIAGRILTPMGRQIVQRSSERAIATGLVSRAAMAVGWGGTVSAGWVTLIGLGIYGLGEWLYYAVKDDAVSQWLRGGPFSGNPDDQAQELLEEDGAYLGLLKSMMPPSISRVTGSRLDDFLSEIKLSSWQGKAESVFSFSSPALAISGEPVSIEWELEYERTVTRSLGRAGTETVASRQGVTRHVDYRFDGSHTLHFVVAAAQLPELTPNKSNYEHMVTRYTVKSLDLTFQVKVWDRHQENYSIREISQRLTDLDVNHHAN